MNAQELKVLADRAATVEGRQAVRLGEVHDRIRTARRQRTAMTLAGTACLVLVVLVGAAILTGPGNMAQPPVPPASPRPSASGVVASPGAQTTISPDTESGDLGGWELLASQTNAEPGREGATELSTIATVHREGSSNVSFFCDGDADTWVSLEYGDGGGGARPCRPGESRTLQPPSTGVGPGPVRQSDTEDLPVRMFLFRPTQDQEDCLREGVFEDCLAANPPVRPLQRTTATFGFAVYEQTATRAVMRVFDNDFQALATVRGEEFLIEHAVALEQGAGLLRASLKDSDLERVVGVWYVPTEQGDACYDAYITSHHLDSESRPPPEAHEECGVELSLTIDGVWKNPLRENEFDSTWGEPWMFAPPGARNVNVEVTHGDPANVRLAVVIWKASS